MIQSAMFFALGFFVSGLAWLAFSVLLVRRARRLTERRVLASLSTRRAEFETERDELRARHAVQMHRVEREVSRILDMATAHRLEADIKERDILNLKAELSARGEDTEDLQATIATQHGALQDLERRLAEAGTALRNTQHALKMEHSRRTAAERALDEADLQADQRRIEVGALRAEVAALRAAIGERSSNADGARGPAGELLGEPAAGGSVVPLPTRARPGPGDAPEGIAALVAEAARDLQQLEGNAQGELGGPVWHANANIEAPPVQAAPEPVVLANREPPRLAAAKPAPDAGRPSADENSETRFFQALAEIRALKKRAAAQAGE